MKSVLVIRLSSMGDVLLTMPLLAGITQHDQHKRIVFVTNQKFLPYFKEVTGIETFGYDPEGRHQGFRGIFRLFSDLRPFRISQVIDLHGVLRTWLLDAMFLLRLRPVYLIKKHRKLRKKILKGRTDVQVPHAVDRYQEVLNRAGITTRVVHYPLKQKIQENRSGKYRIGFAPLTKHTTKNWTKQHIAFFISLVTSENGCEVFLFGGTADYQHLEAYRSVKVHNVAGQLTPEEETDLINSLDLFVSMDSANMHLASLAGIPVISVWGATDPRLGFQAYKQPESLTIAAPLSEVSCRPCSVYGGKPCHRKDSPMLCMEKNDPARVTRLVKEILQKHSANS